MISAVLPQLDVVDKFYSFDKLFDVSLCSVNEANPSLLGNYTYAVDGGKDPIQTFEVDTTAHPKQFFPLVEVTINSNHGNKEYTCLYRIRVHGKIQVPDSTA